MTEGGKQYIREGTRDTVKKGRERQRCVLGWKDSGEESEMKMDIPDG